MKKCKHCGIVLPLSEFKIRKDTGIYRPYCISCAKKKRRIKYISDPSMRIRFVEYAKKRRSTPEGRKKHNDYWAKYRATHRARINELQRVRYIRDRHYHRIRAKKYAHSRQKNDLKYALKWASKNPEKLMSCNRAFTSIDKEWLAYDKELVQSEDFRNQIEF